MQGMANARRDAADLRERLISTTYAAATPTQNVLASARDIARALAALPDIRDGKAACSSDLASAMRGVDFLSNMARVDSAGRVICAAHPQSIGMDTRYLPIWRAMAAQTDFVASGVTVSRLNHRPVIVGLLPLHDAAGRFEGTLNVAVDVHWLNKLMMASPLPAGSVMAVFDRNRHMIAATKPDIARAVFAGARLGGPNYAVVGKGQDKAGAAWTFATAPLLDPNVFVGFAMPENKLFGAANRNAIVDIVLPVVMILLTWVAIWIVTDRQLTRWVIYLRRISAAYRSGHYAFRPTLAGAPSELRSLGDAMTEMAGGIYERDRSLREALAQKSLLVKEIHHRVKNNLQIVMSLLSLQAKRLKDPAAQAALKETRTRINALALVHRVLYEIDDQRTVDVRRLLGLLADQTKEGFAGERRDIRVIVDIVHRELPSDMAVPLSLFTVEALTNAFKHAFPGGRAGTIGVTLQENGDSMLRLAIVDDGVGFDDSETHASIGARLVMTFGQQIGGVSAIRANAGNGTIVEIVFPDPERKSAPAPVS